VVLTDDGVRPTKYMAENIVCMYALCGEVVRRKLLMGREIFKSKFDNIKFKFALEEFPMGSK